MDKFFADLIAALHEDDHEKMANIIQLGRFEWQEHQKQQINYRWNLLNAMNYNGDVTYDSPLLPDEQRLIRYKQTLEAARSLI